jgi:hypothetical protein
MTLGRPSTRVVPQPLQGLAGFTVWLVESLFRLGGWSRNVPSRESQTAEDLLERALAIEATQPSFAADLRAVALRAQGAGSA